LSEECSLIFPREGILLNPGCPRLLFDSPDAFSRWVRSRPAFCREDGTPKVTLRQFPWTYGVLLGVRAGFKCGDEALYGTVLNEKLTTFHIVRDECVDGLEGVFETRFFSNRSSAARSWLQRCHTCYADIKLAREQWDAKVVRAGSVRIPQTVFDQRDALRRDPPVSGIPRSASEFTDEIIEKVVQDLLPSHVNRYEFLIPGKNDSRFVAWDSFAYAYYMYCHSVPLDSPALGASCTVTVSSAVARNGHRVWRVHPGKAWRGFGRWFPFWMLGKPDFTDTWLSIWDCRLPLKYVGKESC